MCNGLRQGYNETIKCWVRGSDILDDVEKAENDVEEAESVISQTSRSAVKDQKEIEEGTRRPGERRRQSVRQFASEARKQAGCGVLERAQSTFYKASYRGTGV